MGIVEKIRGLIEWYFQASSCSKTRKGGGGGGTSRGTARRHRGHQWKEGEGGVTPVVTGSQGMG